jgi:phosphoenolpyruvate carboxykinase (ATP)
MPPSGGGGRLRRVAAAPTPYLCESHAKFHKDPVFGFEVPESLPGLDPKVLDPKSTWPDRAAFDAQAKKLADMYVKNFRKYEGKGTVDYTQYGPKV